MYGFRTTVVLLRYQKTKSRIYAYCVNGVLNEMIYQSVKHNVHASIDYNL